MKTLSISIVLYNDYVDALQAVDTIEEYTTVPKKVFIIDNSCREDSDRTKKMFRWFLGSYEDITYIDTKKNLGFGKGHNRIIPELTSEYHAIVNPDIILKEDSFTKIIDYMESCPECGMCIPRIEDKYGNIQEAYRIEPTVFEMFRRFFLRKFCDRKIKEGNLFWNDYSKPFQVPFAQGCFLVIRTDLFRSLSGFDERFFLYMEDADLSRRCNEVSKVMYFPDTSVIHEWGKGSHKSLRLFTEHVRSMIRYFVKWKHI